MVQMKEPWERRKGSPVEQKASLTACMSARLLDCWISSH